MIDCATKSVDIKPLPWEAQSSFCLSLSTQSSEHNTWTVWILLGMPKNFRIIVRATEITLMLNKRHRNGFLRVARAHYACPIYSFHPKIESSL